MVLEINENISTNFKKNEKGGSLATSIMTLRED